MQDRLSIELNGKIVTSNYFNMKTFRTAEQLRSEEKSLPEIADALVYEMFDGTEITDDILNSLEVNQFVYLSDKVLNIYMDELKKIIDLKNVSRPAPIKVKTGE